MIEPVSIGDLVISIAGRDKGKFFLVVDVDENLAYIVDGRSRKVNKPKKKKLKHLKIILSSALKKVAERIKKGESVGNEKVYQAIKAEKEKIQED